MSQSKTIPQHPGGQPSASTSTSPSVSPSVSPSISPATRVGGFAGMAFAVSVVAQNAWSQAVGALPAPTADLDTVVAAFADPGPAPGVLAGWVAMNMVLLLVFLSGAHQRLRAASPVWAGLGQLGGVVLVTLFAVLQVPVVALAVHGSELAGSPAVVGALWSMHGAIFALTGIALGTALLGFSLAATDAALLPRWFRAAGPAAAAVIVLASAPVEAGARGEPVTLVGVVGFLTWLLLLLLLGNRMRREH